MSVSMNLNLTMNTLDRFAGDSTAAGGTTHAAGAAAASGGTPGVSYGYGLANGRPVSAGDTKSVVPMADGSSITVLRGPAHDVLSVTTVPAGRAGGVDVMA